MALVLKFFPVHSVEIVAQLSNGFEEALSIEFVAIAGGEYLVAGYELAAGQDPATAKFRETPGDNPPVPLSLGLLAAVIVLWPF